MDEKKVLQLDEIHIPIIIRDVLKNIWLIVLAMIVVCIGIYAYANLKFQPQYTTEAIFAVSPRSNGSYVGFYSSLNTASEMAEVFQEVFTSDVLKRLVRKDLENPQMTFEIFSKVEKETNILSVGATANTPDGAHAVMQSVLKNYGQVSGYLFGGVVLDVIKNPHIPITPSNQLNIKSMMLKGALLAAFVMLVLIVLLSIMRNTLKTLSSAKRCMGEAPLGVLMLDKRFLRRRRFRSNKRKGLLITETRTGFWYVESMLQVTHKIRHKMCKNGQKILLVTSVAENEGKSTVAANLALAISKHGQKVALVDMDMRRPAIHKLFREYKEQKYDLLKCLQNGVPEVKTEQNNLHLFLLSKPYKKASRVLNDDKLKRFLDDLCERMDYVILDSAPYVAVADTGFLLKHADSCAMVVRQDWVSGKVLQGVGDDLDSEDVDYLGYIFNFYRDNGTEKVSPQHYGKYRYHEKNNRRRDL